MWGIPVPTRVPASGLGWGRVIRSGSGIPSDALGNLGDRYLDTATGRWYLKRWVGNFDGSDIAMPSSEPPIGTGFLATAVFKTQPSMASFGNVDVMGREISFKLRTAGSKLGLLIGNGTSWGYSNNAVMTLADSTWYRVEVDTLTTPSFIKVRVNGVEIENASATPIGPSVSGFRVGLVTNPSVTRPMAFASYCGSKWSMDEGSGTTLADASGLGRPCTVTDASPATFWLQTWVPLDLLT